MKETLATFTACQDCDLLVRDPGNHRDNRLCPRCGALLWPARRGPDNLALAAAISGLILFLPAVALPIMEVNMVGRYGSHSLLAGVQRLWTESENALAILVMLCSIVAPFFQLLLTAIICLSMRWRRRPKLFPSLIRTTHWMQEWSMLEVFAMGALVAYVKMMDPGEIQLANGAWCLAGLLLSVMLASQQFHGETAWRYWSGEVND